MQVTTSRLTDLHCGKVCQSLTLADGQPPINSDDRPHEAPLTLAMSSCRLFLPLVCPPLTSTWLYSWRGQQGMYNNVGRVTRYDGSSLRTLKPRLVSRHRSNWSNSGSYAIGLLSSPGSICLCRAVASTSWKNLNVILEEAWMTIIQSSAACIRRLCEMQKRLIVGRQSCSSCCRLHDTAVLATWPGSGA